MTCHEHDSDISQLLIKSMTHSSQDSWILIHGAEVGLGALTRVCTGFVLRSRTARLGQLMQEVNETAVEAALHKACTAQESSSNLEAGRAQGTKQDVPVTKANAGQGCNL